MVASQPHGTFMYIGLRPLKQRLSAASGRTSAFHAVQIGFPDADELSAADEVFDGTLPKEGDPFL